VVILGINESEHNCGADHGEGQHASKRHIGGSGVGKADHTDAGGQKEQQPAGAFFAIGAPCEPGECESGQQRADGAGESRGDLGLAGEKFEKDGPAPIEKRRLFEPRFAVKAWCDPIAGLGHIASDPGVAWFVGTDETDHAEMAEIADVEGGYDQNGPAEVLRE